MQDDANGERCSYRKANQATDKEEDKKLTKDDELLKEGDYQKRNWAKQDYK